MSYFGVKSTPVTSSKAPLQNSPRGGNKDKKFTPLQQKKRTTDLISEPYFVTVMSNYAYLRRNRTFYKQIDGNRLLQEYPGRI